MTFLLLKHYLFSKKAGSIVKRISWISVVGVSLGIFSFIVILSVMNGFNNGIHERFLAVEPYLTVFLDEGIQPEKKMTDKLIQNALDSNIQVFGFQKQDVILRTVDGYFEGAIAKGSSEDFFSFFRNKVNAYNTKKYGKQMGESFLSGWEGEIAEGDIVIGSDLATRLKLLEGDLLIVAPPEDLLLPFGEVPRYERVHVKKIITTNVSEIDSHVIYYLIGKTLNTLSEPASLEQGLEIWFPTIEQGLLNDWEEKFKQNFQNVTTWKDRNSALLKSLMIEKIIIGTFVGLSTLIASFSILVAMTLLIFQKRADIAILVSLGLSKKRVIQVFQRMSYLLFSFGMGLGLIVGTIVCLILMKYPLKILPDIYYEVSIPVELNYALIFWVVLFFGILAILGAKLSTRPLYKMNIVHYLRDKKDKKIQLA